MEEIRGGNKRKSGQMGGNGGNLVEIRGETDQGGKLGGTGRNWEELGGTWRKSGVETS